MLTLVRSGGLIPRTSPGTRHTGRLGRRVRGAYHLRQPRIPPARHRPLGGLSSGRFQPLPTSARPVHRGGRLRARLGLHGRDDPHQMAPDRIWLLAGVAAAQSFPKLTHSQDSESLHAPIGHTPAGRSAEFGTRQTHSIRCA